MAIRVLVVDDSAVIRRLVTTVLESDPEVQVVGTANNGSAALDRITQLRPDLVTLDVEMPVMDGLAAMREIHSRWRGLPVIMFSTLTERGASATLDALGAGAADYVTKPANVGSFSAAVEAVRAQLLPKIKALCGKKPVRPAAPRTASAPSTVRPPARVPAVRQGWRPSVLVVGCSTGGPDALSTVMRDLPASFPLPVVVVQHMPALFTRLFSERLDRVSELTVREASGGEELRPGLALVAPGDHHLELRRDGTSVRAALGDGPPENFCRPAVDVLFRSAARTFGPGVLALVLTGMGRDGANGAEDIARAGGCVLAQDEATSVVWGMPGAVAQAGLATAVLPLDQVASSVVAAAGAARLVGTR